MIIVQVPLHQSGFSKSCNRILSTKKMSNPKARNNGMIAGNPHLPVLPPLPEVLLHITKISTASTCPTKAHPSSARNKGSSLLKTVQDSVSWSKTITALPDLIWANTWVGLVSRGSPLHYSQILFCGGMTIR